MVGKELLEHRILTQGDGDLMLAAFYEKKGTARDVIKFGEFDEPSVGSSEVKVKLFASGVNPSDIKRRTGFGALSEMEFPVVIPHNDGAGVIEEVGAGVDKSRLGQRVWVYEAQIGRPFGTAAQRVVVPDHRAIWLPDNTTFDQGACLGVPAMTAHRLVFSDGPVNGKNVLVSGGGGSVASYAIQFAKWSGATVFTTVSSGAKAERAKKSGADFIIDYKKEHVVKTILDLTHGVGVDRIIEVAFGQNLDTNLAIIGTNGIIATYASDQLLEPTIPFYRLILKSVTVRFVFVYAMSLQAHVEAARDINECLATGVLNHEIALRFTLSQVIEAHEAVESGTCVGKVIVDTTRV
jgi:NADPH2:quinone reductase